MWKDAKDPFRNYCANARQLKKTEIHRPDLLHISCWCWVLLKSFGKQQWRHNRGDRDRSGSLHPKSS
jgi:hypothetical protein